MKKEKEKEPEKLDKLENSAAPKKKGFEEEHKDSDDDSSDDEQEKKPEAPKLSKKKLRRMNRFTVAELKQVRPSQSRGPGAPYPGSGFCFQERALKVAWVA